MYSHLGVTLKYLDVLMSAIYSGLNLLLVTQLTEHLTGFETFVIST